MRGVNLLLHKEIINITQFTAETLSLVYKLKPSKCLQVK